MIRLGDEARILVVEFWVFDELIEFYSPPPLCYYFELFDSIITHELENIFSHEAKKGCRLDCATDYQLKKSNSSFYHINGYL